LSSTKETPRRRGMFIRSSMAKGPVVRDAGIRGSKATADL
jgi:hypothetical protein